MKEVAWGKFKTTNRAREVRTNRQILPAKMEFMSFRKLKCQ